MRSTVLLPALWLVGTVMAATVAWYGLSLVGASIDGDETVAIDVGTDDRSTAAPIAAERAAGPTPTTSPVAPDPEPSPTTPPVAETGVVRTFDLEGGRVAIRFSPDAVVVAWAAPADGYETETEPEGLGIEVTFDNGARRSKVEAWWDDGPRYELDERDRSGSGRGDDPADEVDDRDDDDD